jgi:hypothetical protein
MKNIDQIKERYLKESFNMRLGHLASDLARISSFSDKNAIKDLIEESKFFIEWVASEASFEVQVLLAEIQSKLALCQSRILTQKTNNSDLETLKQNAKAWSDKLLEISGLTVV